MPNDHYAIMGYRKAGARAIRIDMLERLADMIRTEDTRGGFEAKADMLSITGLTLEQFADLMQGLGYRAEKGEREKVKAVDQTVPTDEGAAHQADVPPIASEVEEEAAEPQPGDESADAPAGPVFDAASDVEPGAITSQPEIEPTEEPEAPSVPEAAEMPDGEVAPVAEEPTDQPPEDPVAEVSEEDVPVGTPPDADLAGPELETYYIFTWAGNRGGNRGRQGQGQGRGRQDARGKGAPKGKGKGGPKGGGKPQQGKGAGKSHEAGPQKKDRIDPDNPFAAALMGFKDKS